MSLKDRLCAFTAVCEEDACWVPQYLAEVERLGVSFAVHLDRCKMTTRLKLIRHPLCIGYTANPHKDKEFTEQHKQDVLDLVQSKGYGWAMAWDVDETYERTASDKLAQIIDMDCELVQVGWLNLWGNKTTVRCDGDWLLNRRVKFYRLTAGRWWFDHPITNGAKLLKDRPVRSGRKRMARRTQVFADGVRMLRNDLVCLHWGLMTSELRRQHKDRWDRIYGKAVGANPYGLWKWAIETEHEAQVQTHDYF